MEHPDLSYVLKHGYPRNMLSGIENVVSQPGHYAIDVFGNEVLEGDEIAIDHDNFDATILKEHLKRYCIEQLHFKFDRGWVLEADKSDMFHERWLEQILHEEYNFEFKVAD